MKKKIIYKCKVNGVVGRIGKHYGLCAKSKLHGGGCGAHGNTKCIHKIREEVK